MSDRDVAAARKFVAPAWRYRPGPANSVTDVAGIAVGHAQRNEPERGVCTGVTVVRPAGDLLAAPLPAAVHVINGYGKSAGLVQIAELGELESPIVLTGVFGVGSVLAGLVGRTLDGQPGLGDEATGRSFNAVVMECNDSYLHDPRVSVPGRAEVDAAFDDLATGVTAQGTVGAGIGMSTFGFAGGIGTASREVPGRSAGRVAALVLANFGQLVNLRIGGLAVGRVLSDPAPSTTERPGSVIVVLATDLPFDSAQLRRLSRRAQNGLARTGCVTAHGSGEIVLSFSTAGFGRQRVEPDLMDEAFAATAECVEEAVLNAMWHASDVRGRGGRSRTAFPVGDLPQLLRTAAALQLPG